MTKLVSRAKAAFLDAYARRFATERLRKLHLALFEVATRGLGIGNYRDEHLSGELHLIRTLLPKLRPLVVLDVGANDGKYSELVLRERPGAQLFAFEPHPATFKRLQLRAGQLGFTAIARACGGKAGRVRLFDYAEREGTAHASTVRDVIEDVHASSSTAVDVPMTTVDAFCEEQRIAHVDLLKIDVEGAEFDVLLGAEAMLKRDGIDLVHFEFNEMNTLSRHFFRDFTRLLPNFDFFRLLPGSLLPIRTDSAILQQELFGYQNILARRR